MATFDLFAAPERQEIVITHEFDAPRERVYAAMTDPAAIPRWWGPRRLTTTVEKMEPRFGGVWRFVQRDAEGNEFAFRGVYHEAKAPESLVYTFEFELMPGHITMESVRLEEIGGKTRVTNTAVFQSIADRDGMMQSGAEEGARESMERLAELVAG